MGLLIIFVLFVSLYLTSLTDSDRGTGLCMGKFRPGLNLPALLGYSLPMARFTEGLHVF